MPDKEIEVANQYEQWPYPRISLFGRVPTEQLWQINFDWLARRSGQMEISKSPRIWITGCGTFQPYVFSKANPNAEILATDLSHRSLGIAKKRCRLHGARNVKFQHLDLADFSAYPEERFDLIECYGVLMCVPNPGAVLSALATRLKPSGVLRLMVYPHYGRQRVFQLQRLAKILKLSHHHKKDPHIFRRVISKLPVEHPLHYAFHSYDDARTPEGIVDGFLHAGDRAFTGIELSRLIDLSGLEIGSCYHRPWGQPREMANNLGLEGYDPAFWLHYLDLWQSLRTNFILTLIPKNRPRDNRTSDFRHPLFSWDEKIGMRRRMRLFRQAITGVRLDSKTTSGSFRLRGRDVRDMIFSGEPSREDARKFFSPESDPLGHCFRGTSREISPAQHFVGRLGENVPNPLYAHLFDAFTFDQEWNEDLSRPLPSLIKQIELWGPHARPLEDEIHRFGLTPYGTYISSPHTIQKNLEIHQTAPRVSFETSRLEDEGKKFDQVVSFLGGLDIARPNQLSPAKLRELWILLYSYPHLLINFR
jgi:SAM-dependent methyltransferase